MGKNLVRKEYSSDATWTCPAGVTKIRALAFANLQSQIGSQGPTIASHSGYVIDKNGDAYSWGPNANGQLGVGDTVGRSSPVLVASGRKWRVISEDGQSATAIAIDTNGDAYCWGRNVAGQVGDGTVVAKSTPTLVLGGRKWQKIGPGAQVMAAIDVNQDLYTWGDNSSGQLGDNTNISKSSPVLVFGGHKWAQISGGASHMVGLTTDGFVYTWGLGLATMGNGQAAVSTPTLILGSRKYKAIAAGGSSFAIDLDGNLWAWGSNTNGQLGNGTTVNASSATMVIGGLKWRSVKCGSTSVGAISENGDSYAWGSNANGQLGNGDVIPRSSPTLIIGGKKWVDLGLAPSMGIDVNGDIYAWGLNTNGQLGNGNTTDVSSPVLVIGGLKGNVSRRRLVNEIIIDVVPGQTYNLSVLSQALAVGPVGLGQNVVPYQTSPLQKFTPVIIGTTTNPTPASVATINTVTWSRNGRFIDFHYDYLQSASTGANSGSGNYVIPMPFGLTLDPNFVASIGTGYPTYGVARLQLGATAYVGEAYTDSTRNGITIQVGNEVTTPTPWGSSLGGFAGVSQLVASIDCTSIPILEWAPDPNTYIPSPSIILEYEA